MVLIRYHGDTYPVILRRATGEVIWDKDDVKEVDNDTAKILLENVNFSLAAGQHIVEKAKQTTKVTSSDLNNDGVVDRQDAVIAGKTLAEYKKIKQ